MVGRCTGVSVQVRPSVPPKVSALPEAAPGFPDIWADELSSWYSVNSPQRTSRPAALKERCGEGDTLALDFRGQGESQATERGSPATLSSYLVPLSAARRDFRPFQDGLSGQVARWFISGVFCGRFFQHVYSVIVKDTLPSVFFRVEYWLAEGEMTGHLQRPLQIFRRENNGAESWYSGIGGCALYIQGSLY